MHSYRFLIDYSKDSTVEFNLFKKAEVAKSIVTRGGRTFVRKAHKRGIDAATDSTTAKNY